MDPPNGLALAHRRLAIVGLSDAGHQPMASRSGRYIIVYNGEVYNFRQLRTVLDRENRGPWRGGSDTEVLVEAIDAWGLEKTLQRIVGMFAFALWDRTAQTLSLVRDRLGEKPLAYAVGTRGELLFGSDLRAIAASGSFDRTLRDSAVGDYFTLGYIPGTQTIYQRAWKVAPGSVVTFARPDAPPRVEPYWILRDAALGPRVRASLEEAANTLEPLLLEAVQLRMVSDVPLGAFLSGGIDSSLVVALMQRCADRPVQTFSIGNEDPRYDESMSAETVARHLGTDHVSLRVGSAELTDLVPEVVASFDEPFADSSQVPTLLVSRLARRTVTVALSGDGGDELFGGYNRHAWVPRLWHGMRMIPHQARQAAAWSLRRARPETWDRLAALPIVNRHAPRLVGTKVHKLATVLDARSPAEAYDRLQTHWPPGTGVSVAGGASQPMPASLPVAEALMLSDAERYLPDDILTKVDRASMSVSLEVRVPLLDHRVVEHAWSLPLETKVHGTVGKRVLRAILARHVPPALWDRPKMGFGVPIANWLRGPLREWAGDLLEPRRLRASGLLDADAITAAWRAHQSGRSDRAAELWVATMFQAWLEHNASIP